MADPSSIRQSSGYEATTDPHKSPQRVLSRIGLRLHESTTPTLHIEHERVDPLCELLTQNTAANQRYTLDRCRDIAKRIQLTIRPAPCLQTARS